MAERPKRAGGWAVKLLMMLNASKTPRWLSPELLVMVGFVATSECVAAALLGGAASLGARAAAGGLIGTAVGSALLARVALREAPSRAADVRALLGAVGVGASMWALVFALGGEGAARGLAVGATLGLLPSVGVGIVLALLGRTLQGVRMFAGQDALERVGLVAGGAAGLAGAVAIGFVAPRHVAIPIASACVGLVLLAMTWRRDVKRCAWLRDVYAGKAPGYKVVLLDDAHAHARTTEHLAPLVPGSSADAVLLEEPTSPTFARGAYRAAERPRAVALLQHDPGPSVWPIRARAQRAGLFFAMTVALAVAASFAQVHRARAASARAAIAATPSPRISCFEARAVFEYHAREKDEVARALFLTHAQDAQIPAGEGWLTLATARGELPAPDVIARVLAAEAQLPCEGMPRIVVKEPGRRRFKVEARLTVEKDETAALVASSVRAALTAAFEPGETSAHESVQFGFYDRKLRWRVVSTIAQTSGVRSCDVLVDGSRDDVALAPADLPRLEELTLFDAATGKRL